MNWFHRGEERYVEYGSSFPATRAFGVVRSLYDTVYNMNMAHLTPRAQDGLRAPGRRRPAHRLHDLADLPRPHAARPVGRRACTAASPRRPSSATRSTARGELFYADLFDSRNTGCTSRARACPGSATGTPAASAPTWSSTTCSTSCSSRCPTTTPTRTRPGPDGQVVSIAEADRALERIMHVAGGVDAFLERARGDRHVGPLADDRRGAREPRPRPSPTRACWRPRTRRRPRPSWPVCPAARSAHGLRARRGPPRRAGRRRGGDAGASWRGSTWSLPARTARRVVRSRRGELRFAPGGAVARPARARLARRGRPRGARPGGTAGASRATPTPTPSNRLWSALECPHSGDVLASARAGLRVRRLGRRRPRRRRQPRLAAPRRLARACCCSAASTPPERERVVARPM